MTANSQSPAAITRTVSSGLTTASSKQTEGSNLPTPSMDPQITGNEADPSHTGPTSPSNPPQPSTTKFSVLEVIVNKQEKKFERVKGTIKLLEEDIAEMGKDMANLKKELERFSTEEAAAQPNVELPQTQTAKHSTDPVTSQKTDDLDQESQVEKERTVKHLEEETSKPKKKIEPLQTTGPNTEEVVAQPNTTQVRNPTKVQTMMVIGSGQLPQTQAVIHIASQKTNDLDEKGRTTSLTDTNAAIQEQPTRPPQTMVSKVDTMSVIDVARLVKELNARIEQIVNLIIDDELLISTLVSDNIPDDEIRDYLGPWLCNKLRDQSEFDSVIATITLETGLANACSCIINDSPIWCDGSILHNIHTKMAKMEGYAIADKWKAKAHNYMDDITLSQCEDESKKYLTKTARKLITVVVGDPEKSESLLSLYNQQVEGIARKAACLHKIVTEDVKSVELLAYIVPCDTEFNDSQMEHTEKSTAPSKVICTQGMGLLCRNRVEPKKPRGSIKEWGVTMKAKVVLADTLENDDHKRT